MIHKAKHNVHLFPPFMNCCQSWKYTFELKMPQPTNWGSLHARLQSYLEASKSWTNQCKSQQTTCKWLYLSDSRTATSLNLHLLNQRSLFPYLLQFNYVSISCITMRTVLRNILLGTKLDQEQKLQSSVTCHFLNYWVILYKQMLTVYSRYKLNVRCSCLSSEYCSI